MKNRCGENALFKQTAFEQLRLPIVPSKNAVVVITVRRQSFGLRHSRCSKSTPLRLQLQDRLLSWSGVWSRLWPRLNWSSQPGRFTVIYSRPLGFLRQYFTFIVCLCCCSTGFSPQSGSDTWKGGVGRGVGIYACVTIDIILRIKKPSVWVRHKTVIKLSIESDKISARKLNTRAEVNILGLDFILFSTSASAVTSKVPL